MKFLVSLVFKDTDGAQVTKLYQDQTAEQAAKVLSAAISSKKEILQFAVNSPTALQAQRQAMQQVAQARQLPQMPAPTAPAARDTIFDRSNKKKGL